MTTTTKNALPVSHGFKRVIGSYTSYFPGPTLLCICSIHGNEPSGLRAFEKVMARLTKDQPKLRGQLVGLAGNLSALEKKVRFIDKDLNRLWAAERVQGFKDGSIGQSWHLTENTEQKDLLDHMQEIFSNSPGPIYVLDLHTTSSSSLPFISINDTIRNRNFARHFPMPIILGIEEHLNGTILNYINELGYIAIGIEAGQHDDPASIKAHEAAIWVALEKNGCIEPGMVPQFIRQWLKEEQARLNKIFEVRYRHGIEALESFTMYPGFQNFQSIKKNQPLAESNQGEIKALETGTLLMPLYQKQGDDGFFIVRRIKPFWLVVSKWLRSINAHRILPYFPGITKHQGKHYELEVNTNIARWYVIEFFHLMGFRRKEKREQRIIFRRREHDFRGPEDDQKPIKH